MPTTITITLPVVISCFGCLLVFSLLYIIYKPPAWLMGHFQRRWPDVLFQVSTSQKIMALTIDDGPSHCTAEIQAILDSHGVKATFFLIGAHMTGHEETLRELARNGHELANHAMRDEPSRALPSAELSVQIQQVGTRLQEIHHGSTKAQLQEMYPGSTGTNRGGKKPSQQSQPSPPQQQQPMYFRPGSGFFSSSMRKLAADLGYRIVLGSIYPHDAQIPYWKLNAHHILSMARPGGIIVCHDRSWTPAMLRAILPELRERGYHIVTVTELLKAAHGSRPDVQSTE